MRSFTGTARATASCADRPSSASGDWRKAVTRSEAPSTSLRRGRWAGIRRPAVIPAIDAWRPDSIVAAHIANVTTTYGHVRQTLARPRATSATAPPTTTASAATLKASEYASPITETATTSSNTMTVSRNTRS